MRKLIEEIATNIPGWALAVFHTEGVFVVWWFNFEFYPACALRALELLLADSGVGEDFVARQPFFFMKTAVTRKRKVENSIPRWEMDCLSAGYKRAIDKIWGRMAKKRIFGPITEFLGPKKSHFLVQTMFLPQPGKVVQTKKIPFSQINISL